MRRSNDREITTSQVIMTSCIYAVTQISTSCLNDILNKIGVDTEGEIPCLVRQVMTGCVCSETCSQMSLTNIIFLQGQTRSRRF